MRKLVAIGLFLCSGCMVQNADRFQLGGEVRFETSGILEYVTGLKLRVFGGIILERKISHDERFGSANTLPIDALIGGDD